MPDPTATEPLEAGVIGTAKLVVTAFRLKDERSVILTLRKLAEAVGLLETAEAAAEEAIAHGDTVPA